MVSALLFAAAATAQPSPEALQLGQQLARVGTLSALLPALKESELEEIIKDHPELTQSDQDALRNVAIVVYATGRDRLFSGLGRAYAERLSIADLRAILAFQSSPAGKRYREATPAVIAETMKSVGKVDFKADVLSAFCKETGKLCAK
jgi:hypothetical protein